MQYLMQTKDIFDNLYSWNLGSYLHADIDKFITSYKNLFC